MVNSYVVIDIELLPLFSTAFIFFSKILCSVEVSFRGRLDFSKSLCHFTSIMAPELTKKICMLGPYSVGKTSLVKQFVHGIFSEKYLVTIGVKIDKKELVIQDQKLKLMLWDIAGEEDEFSIPLSYLKGSDGCILVMDGTRPETIDQAIDIEARARQVIGDIPLVRVINKSDLTEQWQITPDDMDQLETQGPVVRSSARLGTGVEELFFTLSRQMLNRL